MRIIILSLLSSILLSSCAMLKTEKTSLTSPDYVSASAMKRVQQNSIHTQIERLVRQLLSTTNPIDTSKNIAVGSILPATDLDGDFLPQDMALSSQIHESVITLLTQAGLNVVEYRAMPAIKLNSRKAYMLSNDTANLQADIAAEFFVTGTFSKQETSTVVNLRLISLPDNKVLGAATDYIANDSMWSSTKVSLKDNHIYRNEY